MKPLRRRPAFTLIEVLVVVAIIAIMIAILLPSLNRVRIQAKITSCAANSKQIATATAEYQVEWKGYVPIMFNYFSNQEGQHSAPARACWLSVALRHYDTGTARLKTTSGGKFDPEEVWDDIKRDDYENNVMPEQYACPFERNTGNGREIVNQSDEFRYYEWQGNFESYHTWLWEDIVSGHTRVHNEPWPGTGGGLRGVPKYTVFSWNMVRVNARFPNGEYIQGPGPYSAGTQLTDPSKTAYRQWTIGDVRRMRSGSMSTTTVAYCAQGEHMLLTGVGNPVGRANVDSHRRTAGGGTNAIFADTHVEWIEGTRIGWP